MEHQISARLDRPLGDENLPEHYVDPSTTLGGNTVEKQVSDENEKEHYVPQEPHPPNTAEPEPSVPPKASKILGLRRRVFFLIVAVIAVLVVVGAVVGGVVGSRSSNKASSNESSSAPGLSANSTSAIASSTVAVGSSSSVPTTSPRSVATRSSSATRTTASTISSISSTPSVLVDKSKFKIPSIALTGAGSSRDSQLFALHSSNNSVTFHVKTTSGWQSMQGANEPSLPQAPAPGSALAATSWIDGNSSDEIRLYYISNNIEIMELSGSCSSATVCDWSSGRVVLDSGVSPTSGLAVMHWGNSTVANNIVLLFVTSEDTLGQLTYDGLNWSYGISVSVGVAAGSGLAAVIQGDDDPSLRAYWIEVSGGTNGLNAAPTGTTVPWTVSSDVPYSSSANLTPKAELASCIYPSQDLSIDYLVLFQISTTGDVVEMVKQAGVGVWAPATSSFDQAEDAGGAIGCDGWSDDDDLQNLLVVYATGGLVTEYLLHDGSWSNATIFEE